MSTHVFSVIYSVPLMIRPSRNADYLEVESLFYQLLCVIVGEYQDQDGPADVLALVAAQQVPHNWRSASSANYKHGADVHDSEASLRRSDWSNQHWTLLRERRLGICDRYLT